MRRLSLAVQVKGRFDFDNYNTIYMPNKAVHTMEQGFRQMIMTDYPDMMAGMSEEDAEAASKPYYIPIFQLKSVDDLEKVLKRTSLCYRNTFQ